MTGHEALATMDRPEPSVDLCLTRNAAVILETRRDVLAEQLRLARKRMTPDRIHDLRVASRRFRAALSTFRPLLEGPGRGKLRRMARSLTRKPGELRNRDVGREILQTAARKTAGGPAAAAARRYRRDLESESKALRRAVRDFIRGFDFDAFDKRVRRLVKQIALRSPLPLAPETVLGPIWKRIDEVFGRRGAALDPDDVQAQHLLRISFKRLRYTLEVFAFAFDRDARKILRQLRGFQDVLGAMHDLDVLLDGLAERFGGESETASKEAVARLAAYLRGERRRLFRRFAARMKALDRDDLDARIARALRVE